MSPATLALLGVYVAFIVGCAYAIVRILWIRRTARREKEAEHGAS